MTVTPCPVSRTEIIDQPSAQRYPNIPLATDLRSALAAINAIRQSIMIMRGQLGAQPRSQVAQQSNTKSGSNKAKPAQQGKFVEIERVEKKVRIFNKEDKEQFVDVERINKLVFRDSTDGETWTWQR